MKHLQSLQTNGFPVMPECGAPPPGAYAARSVHKLDRIRKRWRFAALMFGLSGLVQAEMPERGLYWAPLTPHQAYYIEHQNDRVTVLSFAYNEQGQAEWFSASGTLQTGTTLDEEFADPSLHHFLRAPVVRLRGGPVLGFSRASSQTVPTPSGEVVGEIVVNFSPTGAIHVGTDTTLPSGPQRRSSGLLRRFNFGFGGFGKNSDVPYDRCWPNLEGEWVFIDRSQRSRAPWRFKFTNVLVRAWSHVEQRWLDGSQMTCRESYQPHEIIYRDEVANVDLRCALTQGHPPPDFPDQGDACEVIDRTASQTLFYFFGGGDSAQQNRVMAYFGTPRDTAPPSEFAPIVGIRVE